MNIAAAAADYIRALDHVRILGQLEKATSRPFITVTDRDRVKDAETDYARARAGRFHAYAGGAA